MYAAKILDRYVFKEVLGPFFFAVCGCVIIGIADFLFMLMDLVVNSGVHFFAVMKLITYKIPAIMVLFFPMAMLFSIMIALVRMAKDSEVTVLRSSGVNTIRLIIPFVLVSVLISGMAFMISEYVVPWANHVSESILREAILKKPPPDIAENVVFKETGGRFFYIKKIDSKKNIMQNLIIYETLPDFPRVISAKKATWDTKTWVLYDGIIHKYDKDGIIKYQADFKKMDINVDRDVNSFYTKQKTAKEMDSSELKDRIKDLDKGGIKTDALKVELHMKYSTPFASLSFALLAIALCISLVNSGKDWWGVIISIIVAVLSLGFYMLLSSIFRSFGRGGFIDPFWAAWLPNLIYSTVGMFFIWQKTIKR